MEGLRALAARLFVGLQTLLPQHALSRAMYRLARVRWRPFKGLLIGAFRRLYAIDMSEARESDPAAYPHFNAFFTRALRADARPRDPDPAAILSPVDGTVSQIGLIRHDSILQAKGCDYRLDELLACSAETARDFVDGAFATIYLSPSDYHRIHMPVAGRLSALRHVPGRLFSVNAVTAERVPRLFARNERLVCEFATPAGPLALVMVGAIFVGGMETVWAGEITPAALVERRDTSGPVELAAGAEMGRFNLGSTVILLFPPGVMRWEPDLAPGSRVRLHQRLGRRN